VIELSPDLDLGLDTTRMTGTSDAERQRVTSQEVLTRFFHADAAKRWELQLVADEVGMGKTFVALAIAHAILASMRGGAATDELKGCAPRVLIIAPHQTLAQKWKRETAEFVKRCIVADQRDATQTWFTPTPVDRPDDLANALAGDQDPTLIITHMGVLSGQSKLKKYDQKRRALLEALFRVWGNRFGHDARERLLRGAPEDWHSEAPVAWEETGFQSADELVRTLRALEQHQRSKAGEGAETPLDQLLERCRDIAQPHRRDRAGLFTKIEPILTKLYRQACFAKSTAGIPLVIVDEAHHWRNGPRHNTNGYGVFQEHIAPRCRRALLLTATPFQLRPAEVLELLKAGEAIAPSFDPNETMARREKLRRHREEVIAPVLQQAAQQSRQFAQAWKRLPPTQSDALTAYWTSPALTALRERLTQLAADAGSLEPALVSQVLEPHINAAPVDLRDLLRESLRLFAYNQDLSCELGALVIRHRRRTDHRLCAIGEEYAGEPGAAVQQRSDRHLLHAARGLDVAGEAELPHYLLMRCVSELKQGKGRTSLGSSLTGCYSTLLASGEGSQLKKAAAGSVGQRYFELLEQMVGVGDDAKHPKVAAVVDAVMTAWKAGHKSLIFCFRTNTAKRLTDIIDTAIERELQQRLHSALPGEDALTRLRNRFARRDDDLASLALDRVLWSLRWAAQWEQRPLSLPILGADALTLRDEELGLLARLALRAGIDLRDEKPDRLFVHRATEHLLARRLLRELPHPGPLFREVLGQLTLETWIERPYGFDPSQTHPQEAPNGEAEADEQEELRATYTLTRTPTDSEAVELGAYLVERRSRARQQDQISVFDSYARSPSFWLGVDVEGYLQEPGSRTGQALAAHHAHLLNAMRSGGLDETAGARPASPQRLYWGERLRLVEALRRTVVTRSVLLRLMPERRDIEGQGWAEALVDMYYRLLPGQHETFAERLSVFAEDFQAASGSAWTKGSARNSLYEASRLRWVSDKEGERRSGNVARVAGDTDPARRERVFAAFNSPLPPDVLVCTSVAQEGIDLHRHCRHVIHHDLAWNPSEIEQRTGRIDRIGSKAFRDRRLVPADAPSPFLSVGIPFLAGTYDERMYEELRIRAQTFEVLTGGDVTTDAVEDDETALEGTEEGLSYPVLPTCLVNDLRVRLHVWE
jgi:Helicase conserved C-terminal domain/SNF2-related domain